MSSEELAAAPAVTFADLNLSDKVVSAVADAGYTTPTPIQAKAIPHAVAGKDVLGIAQTGTGKTAAFVLPMITRLEKGRARARMPRTLILEPTRELAAQVEENFVKYGKNHKLNIALLIGGVSFEEQNRKLERGVDVLIATPGRMLDHTERGKLLLTGVEILVIDEADRMLDMGFIPDIERICKMLPFTRQTLFFSATMPPEITKLTEQFLQAPIRVEVSKPATTGVNITQRLVKSKGKSWDKRETLRNLIRAEDAEIKNAIIFCNRKVEVAELFRSLLKHEFSVGALHGDMDQRARTTMLENFRNDKLKLLVASDVAARGLDIPDVSHVFNYDVPIHAEDYVHRIGRTGRAGRSGKAFTLVTKSDTRYLDAIEKLTGTPIAWLDGDLSTVGEESAEEERPRRGRGDRREKGERSERSSGERSSGERSSGERRASGGGRERAGKPRREQAVVDAPAVEEAIVEAPVVEAVAEPRREERRGRRDAIRSGNDERNSKPRPAASGDYNLSRPEQKRRYRDEFRDDPAPVGFGDDVPDFMKVVAKV